MVSVAVTRTESLDGELKPSHGCLILVIVFSVVVVLNVAVALIALFGTGLPPTQWGDSTIAALVSNPAVVFGSAVLSQAVFLSAVPLAITLSNCSGAELLALRPSRPLNTILAVIGMLGFGLFGDLLIALLRQWRPDLDSAMFEIMEMVRGLPLMPQFLVVMGIGLLPAVCEEALFRGVLFTAFLRRWGGPVTVVVTSLMFAIMHLDPLQSPAAFVLGCYLGMIRLRTNSLWPSAAAHGANNLVAMLLAVSGGSSAPRGSFLVWAVWGLLLGLLVLPMLRPADER